MSKKEYKKQKIKIKNYSPQNYLVFEKMLYLKVKREKK
jgi:hypothetical protein